MRVNASFRAEPSGGWLRPVETGSSEPGTLPAAFLALLFVGGIRDDCVKPRGTSDQFAIVRDQVQRRRNFAHRTQKTGYLAPVMRGVIHHMQHDLPQRG